MLKIGHRRAKAYEPENTLRSFGRALELGANAVEFDVRKTRDNQIVVIHDADVKRTTDGAGLVGELTLEQVKSFTTEKGEHIPTLEETLEFVSRMDRKARILVELKEEGLEEQVLSLVHKMGLQRNVIVISFVEDALRRVRALDAEVETGLIYARHKDPVGTALELRAQYLVAFYKFTHTSDVQKAHKRGLKIVVWTVDDSQEVAAYVKKGVDGIASNKPDIL